MTANTAVSTVNIPRPKLTAFKEYIYTYIYIYIYAYIYIYIYKYMHIYMAKSSFGA